MPPDSSSPVVEAPAVERHEGWLRVRFGDGRHADFHHFWLRHNCDLDRHPVTGERTLCSSEVPLDLRVAEAAVRDDALLIRWDEPGGRQSRYPLAWLAAHAYAPGREAEPPPPADLARIEIGGGLHGAALGRACLARAREAGAVLLRGYGSGPTPAPEDTEALIADLAAAGLQVVGTHFGRIEDLRTDNTTNENTDQLGYTDAGIDAHTDQPFLERPPRYQLLHCLRAADEGGESFLTDGLQAARHLRSIDRPAFELLTRVRVAFDRRQRAFERRQVAPILAFGLGDDLLIRYSYFTMAPHRLPFAEMEAFYRAYNRFAALVRDPRHQYRLTLRPGDLLLYDNHRMLHGRTAFSGPRWLRGVYFEPAPPGRPASGEA